MTTKIRIEKADGHTMIVLAQEQHVDESGKWVNSCAPKVLQFPAQQFEDNIHQNKRYIVQEMPLGNS